MRNKKINSLLITASLLLFGVLTSSQAHADAGTCSAGDPCGTYAVLDSSNNIINSIVCQAAVCGGGTFGGQTVVLQMPTNPNGSGNPQAGYFGSYNPQNNTFTVPSYPSGSSISEPVTTIKVDNGQTITDTIKATVNYGVGKFTAPTSITDPFTPFPMSKTTSAVISAKRNTTDLNGSTIFVGSESATLLANLTSQQILQAISSMTGEPILASHSTTFLHLLITMGY
jgi:hypothetical protein